MLDEVRKAVSKPEILRAMGKVARHLFVDEGLRPRSYDNCSLPIGERQTISQPSMIARMIEALALEGSEKILEIGTGSGYQTALLAELGLSVFSIERIAPLAERARRLLDSMNYYQVAVTIGDGTLGWLEHALYDRILVTAASPGVPKPLIDQLEDRGRMVIPIGNGKEQELRLVTKTGQRIQEVSLGNCHFVRLIGKYGCSS